MSHQTLLLLMSFLMTTCACDKSYLKFIGPGHKYYSERMWKALHVGLVSVLLA